MSDLAKPPSGEDLTFTGKKKAAAKRSGQIWFLIGLLLLWIIIYLAQQYGVLKVPELK